MATTTEAVDHTADGGAGGPERPSGWRRRLPRYHAVGFGFAAAFFCLSVTPSLLPRGWLLQGLIGGISAAIGYGVGVLAMWLVRKL
ncbi:MAG TPA: alpha/beta-hydrolase N-terminal domain-containing protein, partial [Micromonosporaceae bacterium]|nr:alpha/beta-hydrolase N-terminal domain-containing protein [Micromonosporaceae bacterium]